MARRAAVRPEAEGCLPSACGHLRPAGVSAVGTPGSREAGRPGCRPPFPGAGCDRGPRERSPGCPRAPPRLGSRAHPVGPRRAGPRSCSPLPCTCPGAAPTAGKRRCPWPLPLTCFQDRSRRGEGRRALCAWRSLSAAASLLTTNSSLVLRPTERDAKSCQRKMQVLLKARGRVPL